MNYVVLYSGFPLPETIKTIDQAKKYFVNVIQPELKKKIEPFLKKGGFIYGADLYKNFTIKINKTGKQKIKITFDKYGKVVNTKKVIEYKYWPVLFFDIYFEDTNNDGCDYVLQQIKKTGLLQRDLYIKNKCLSIT